jgi:hypothetical protein
MLPSIWEGRNRRSASVTRTGLSWSSGRCRLGTYRAGLDVAGEPGRDGDLCGGVQDRRCGARRGPPGPCGSGDAGAAAGVGERGVKNDKRDAQQLSKASWQTDVSSVHIPSKLARELRSLCGARDVLVGTRTKLINNVRGWMRTQLWKIRGGDAGDVCGSGARACRSGWRAVARAHRSSAPDAVGGDRDHLGVRIFTGYVALRTRLDKLLVPSPPRVMPGARRCTGQSMASRLDTLPCCRASPRDPRGQVPSVASGPAPPLREGAAITPPPA